MQAERQLVKQGPKACARPAPSRSMGRSPDAREVAQWEAQERQAAQGCWSEQVQQVSME